MGGNSSTINLFGQRAVDNFNRPNLFDNNKNNKSENPLENLIVIPPPSLNGFNGEKILQSAVARRELEQKFQIQQTANGDLNGLSEQTPVSVAVKPGDTQADVLRRAYQTYAATAGLDEANAKTYVDGMMSSGGEQIQHRNSDKLFSAKEFQAIKKQGSIEMYPTAAQLAELRQWKAEESEVITVESKAYGAVGEITFRDTTRAGMNSAVIRRYLQQNLLGAGFYFVEHGDEAAQRAIELGVKPELEPTGATNEAGETVYRIKFTAEDAEKLQQVKTEYDAKKAIFEGKMEQARENTDQMFIDQGRVLWNSTVNIAEGTVNQAIDMTLTGGTNPIPLMNPNRPQVDFSGAKTDYRSEMMRRDLNGKLDGDGIKAGQFIETGVTILAPFVVGAATTPKAAPQSLKTLGGLPEAEVATAATTTNSATKAEQSTKWVDKAGKTIYPPNDGFAGIAKKVVIKPGTFIDRFGFEGGNFVSPKGVPYAERSLPPGSATKPYHIYEVIKPIEGLGGKAASWFGEPGGGMQFMFEKTIQELKDEGYIIERFLK